MKNDRKVELTDCQAGGRILAGGVIALIRGISVAAAATSSTISTPSPLVVTGANQKILNNTLRKSGGELIAFITYNNVPITGTKIVGNDCRQYGCSMIDSGTAAIYSNGNSDLGGAEIAYNFIADNLTDHKRVACGSTRPSNWPS